jgi:hypothetical protein
MQTTVKVNSFWSSAHFSQSKIYHPFYLTKRGELFKIKLEEEIPYGKTVNSKVRKKKKNLKSSPLLSNR